MTRDITMRVLIKAIGQEEVSKLETTLRNLGKAQNANNILIQRGRNLNQADTDVLIKKNVALQARLKSGQRSIEQLATEMVLNEQLSQSWQRRLAIEMEAVRIRQQMTGVSTQYSQYLANESLIVDANTQANLQNQKSLMMRRRELLGTTMAIFGMTMSIWQLTNALGALAGDNEDVKDDIKSLQAVMMGATGPMLLYMGYLQLMTIKTTQLGTAMLVALPAMFALASIYMALTANSRELRVIFGALAGAMTVLAVKQTIAAITARAHAAAIAGNTQQTLLNYAITSLGALLPVLAGAAIGALAIYATLPSAQTGTGQERQIEETGFFFGHKGETVATVSPAMESGGTRGGDTVVILEVDGEELGRAVARQAEKEGFMG